MSVRTQIERINGEVSEQAALLAQLDAAVDALPDAGGGGGGSSLETCEVTVIQQWGGNTDPMNGGVTFYYTTVSADGTLTNDLVYLSSESDFELEHRVTFTAPKNVPVIIRISSQYWDDQNGSAAVTGGSLGWYRNYIEMSVGDETTIGRVIPTEDTVTITTRID